MELRKTLISLVALLYLADAKNSSCNVDPNAVADRRLRETILCNYDPNVIPLNPPDIVKIEVKLNLYVKHVNMNERKGTMTVSAWVAATWSDGQLKWNVTEFGSQNKLVVSSKLLWTPDLTIYNAEMTQEQINHDPVNCMLYDSGFVACAFNLNAPIYCQADMRLWPFDVKSCMLEIGSWAYDDEQMLIEKNPDFESLILWDKIFSENKQWKVTDTKCENVNDTFPYVSWVFKIQRHAGVFEAAFIAPAFVLAGCTLLSFWVKSLTHRLLLCCLALVCNALFLMGIVGQIHEYGDEKPNIVVAYRDSIVFSLIALLFCIVVPWTATAESPEILIKISDAIRNRAGSRSHLLLGVDLEQHDVEQNEPTHSRPKCDVFAPLLDRMAFAALFVFYTLMLLSLLP